MPSKRGVCWHLIHIQRRLFRCSLFSFSCSCWRKCCLPKKIYDVFYDSFVVEGQKINVIGIAQFVKDLCLRRSVCEFSTMDAQRDLFSNKLHLKQTNKNFDYFIQLVQATYTPLLLSSEESLGVKEISFEFLQEFNGSHANRQIQLLSDINHAHQLWIFLSLNPTSYDCQTFIEELYHLTSASLAIKQHLGKFLFWHPPFLQ